MNAGGVSEACKSNGPMIPARGLSDSGRRVSNTLEPTFETGIAPRKRG